MNISQRVAAAGSFRAQLIRRDGSIKQDTGWQKNMVLNQGFNYLVSRVGSQCAWTGLRQLVVGSGDEPVSPTDTTLDSFVARKATNESGNTTTAGDSFTHEQVEGVAYGHFTRTYLFDFGEANGNLRELGVEFVSSSNTLATRALFTGEGGVPITIEKTSEDQLRISYRITLAVPMVEESEGIDVTVDGSPVATTMRIRPNNVGVSLSGTQRQLMNGPGVLTDGRMNIYPDNTSPSGFTGNGPNSVSGSSIVNNPSGMVESTSGGETDGVWWAERSMVVQPSFGNPTGGEIGSFNVGSASSSTGTDNQHTWLVLFTPKIPKNSTRRLRLSVTTYYSRLEDES
jgi:hypothetical protein